MRRKASNGKKKIGEGRRCFMLGDHGRVRLDRTYEDNFHTNRQRKVINYESTQMMSKGE